MINVTNLTKLYGTTEAVRDLSFTINKGEIVGFLGPNGAGKSTTMRILSTYLAPTSGSVEVAGYDVLTQSLNVRRHIGYLPENVPLYDDMRVLDYLRYRGKLKGLRGRQLRRRIDYVLGACGLDSVIMQVITRLSKGYRQRVGLADALIHDPDVLILDEPTIGLDPNQIRDIRHFIRGLAGHHTILLSSHILPEVEATCERVIIISHGKIAASDTTRDLVGKMHGTPRVHVEARGPQDEIVSALNGLPAIRKVTASGKGEWNQIVCEGDSGADMCPSIFSTLSSRGWEVRELRTEAPKLEDVFVSLTSTHGSARNPDTASGGEEGGVQ